MHDRGRLRCNRLRTGGRQDALLQLPAKKEGDQDPDPEEDGKLFNLLDPNARRVMQALAAYQVPVTFLVLRNEEYAILKWFAQMEAVTGAPGLDLPKLESAAIAGAYGLESRRVDAQDELRDALAESIGANEPRMIETRVAPGMALG